MVTISTKNKRSGVSCDSVATVINRLTREGILLLILLIMALERLQQGIHPGCNCDTRSQNNLRGITTEPKAAAWPPGGVEWDTGDEAVERARNKLPPPDNEISSNHPVPFLEGNVTFKESALFHKWLDGLEKGIEIGSSAHNGFGLDGTLNVDFSAEMGTFKQSEVQTTGVYRRVDVVAPGNRLPFGANSLDYVISSHAVEHFHDPIGFVCEAARVVRPGGYIASILPRQGAHAPDAERDRTTLSELIYRHRNPIDPSKDDHRHWQVWMVEDMIEMYGHMNMVVVAAQPEDDKVGNGFSVIARVPGNKFDINCS